MTILPKGKHSKNLTVLEVHDYGLCIESREIFLHSHIITSELEESDPGVDYRMANTFLKNLRILEADGTDAIVIHQQSMGGYWTDGMMIYDAIKLSPLHITMVCHGMAASMGSIIPQAADLRLLMPHCSIMLHPGSIYLEGTHKAVQSAADYEKTVHEQMLSIYIDACARHGILKDKSRAEIKKYLTYRLDKKEDWWLTPESAVELGLFDGIIGEGKYTHIKNTLFSV